MPEKNIKLKILLSILMGVLGSWRLKSVITPYLLGGKSFEARSPAMQSGLVVIYIIGISFFLMMILLIGERIYAARGAKILQVPWQWMKRHSIHMAFLFFLVVFLCLNVLPRSFVLYYDAKSYWGLGNFFLKNGEFSFQNFNFPLRGYLFPFLLLLISRAADLLGLSAPHLYEFVMSLVYSAFLSVIVPELIFQLYEKPKSFLRILIFGLLSILFWRGSFYYPLTDLPAFIMVVSGVTLVIKYQHRWWAAFLAGLLWGGASLFRPSYQIVLVPLLLWLFYYCGRQMGVGLWVSASKVLCALVGMGLVFAPQTAINKSNYNIASPFAQTQLRFGGTDLFTYQLGLGIDGQKYETNIGSNYPLPSVWFLDFQGQNILVRAGYKSLPVTQRPPIGPDEHLTLGKYLKLVLTYPVDFLTIYFRHLFNGLDVAYDTVYVKDVYAPSGILRLINYSLLYIVIIYSGSRIKLRGLHLDSRIFLPLIFVLPAIISIPAVVEVRFMLPLHFLLYALVAYWVLPEFFALDRGRKRELIARHVFWYICFILLCFTMSANTYMGLEYRLPGPVPE